MTFDTELKCQGVVAVRGEVDLRSAEQFRSALEDAARDSAGVVVDLSGVSFMDSTGLNELLRLHAAGRRVVVRSAQPTVLRLFQVGGVAQLLGVCDAPNR